MQKPDPYTTLPDPWLERLAEEEEMRPILINESVIDLDQLIRDFQRRLIEALAIPKELLRNGRF